MHKINLHNIVLRVHQHLFILFTIGPAIILNPGLKEHVHYIKNVMSKILPHLNLVQTKFNLAVMESLQALLKYHKTQM